MSTVNLINPIVGSTNAGEAGSGMAIRHKHLPELQSLRGLAAIVVLLHHCAFVFATAAPFRLTTEALFNAHAAVMIFFVLSGYVLTQSLTGSHFTVPSTGRFYVRRFFRIYPAIAVVSLFSAIYLFGWRQPVVSPDFSVWYAKNYRAGFPSSLGLILSLAGWRNELIPPLWTVRIEIIASLALPFAAFIIRKGWGLPLLLASTVLLFRGGGSIASYFFCFALGGYLQHSRSRWDSCAGWPLLISATLFMYFIRLINADWRFEIDDSAAVPTFLESIGAAVVIGNIVVLDVYFLRTKILVWLGDISYSVYLVHFLILSILAQGIERGSLDAPAKAMALTVATLLATLPLAHFLYKYVELPGIALGNRSLDWLVTKSFRAKNQEV